MKLILNIFIVYYTFSHFNWDKEDFNAMIALANDETFPLSRRIRGLRVAFDLAMKKYYLR